MGWQKAGSLFHAPQEILVMTLRRDVCERTIGNTEGRR
jgi:hypothetical protein